jgi:cobalt-zinc-cadmium efflux system outer membrane protein
MHPFHIRHPDIYMRTAWLLCCAVGLTPAAWADPVSFSEALARAGSDAPAIAARQAAADSARLLVKPAGQLPDPQLALSIDNYPISGPDRFRLNRDEMTMLNVGVMQDMPSEASRRAREGLARAEVTASLAAIDITRLEAQLAAANAWLEAFYAERRVAILMSLAGDAAALEQATTASFSTGAGKPDAALSARLQSARLEDRISDAKFEAAAARVELERWIGPLGQDTLGPSPPDFAIDPAALRAHIEHHVEVAGSSASIARAQAEMEQARASREPDWSWSVMYGRRDPAFGDMLSFGLKFSLPLFQSDRQSPTIDARRADVRRAEADRETVLREHRAMLEAKLAEHDLLTRRLSRSREVVLPLAKERESVASAAHASGTLDLAELFAMRLEVKEVELERLDLERRLALVDVYLALEYGEAQS